MSELTTTGTSRRDFLKTTGVAAGAAAFVGAAGTYAYAGESNVIKIALVGCGGRGTGAAANALSVPNGHTRLVAMADVFEPKVKGKHAALSKAFPKQVEVPKAHRFVGFDAYKKAMDTLDSKDIVILTTPPAFRWVHFTYAIERGINVFMEKPVSVDGPTSRKMFKLGEQSVKKGMKVGVGLMCRHCKARQALFERIKDGEIGDITELRAYRMAGPTASAASPRKPPGIPELHYQIKRFHSFLWLSGGAFSDFLIHNLDESCWMKDAWPIHAEGSGGRHFRGEMIDQNFDNYNVEYTFADGTKLFLRGRTIPGCYNKFASYAHGTKGSAVISTASHIPAKSRIYKGWDMKPENKVWAFPQPEPNPYQVEWNDLIDAIRKDRPYNEVKRGVQASLVASMGRMACHTGQLITYDQILNHGNEFAPNVDKLTLSSESPLRADKNGKYPVPLPGITKKREY
jgi:predicted dehydrogenase